MENLIGQEVWVAEYSGCDTSDCNGIFTTREKAIESVHRDYERCSDVWLDFEEFMAQGDDETIYFVFRVVYPPLQIDEICGCIIYKTEIQ